MPTLDNFVHVFGRRNVMSVAFLILITLQVTYVSAGAPPQSVVEGENSATLESPKRAHFELETPNTKDLQLYCFAS